MISANEAREKTEEVRNSGFERELKRIEHEIEEAIRKGDNNIALDGTISRQTANYMQQLGYEVHSGSQYNESYFTIKW